MAQDKKLIQRIGDLFHRGKVGADEGEEILEGKGGMKKVLITGVGRCATLSIAESLEPFARHENIKLWRVASNRRFDLGSLECKDSSQAVVENSMMEWRGYPIEVSCLGWNVVDLLVKNDPDLAVVQITRDRADSVASMMKTPLYVNGSIPFKDRATRGFIDCERADYSEADRMYNCERTYKVRHEAITTHLRTAKESQKLVVSFEQLIGGGDWLRLTKFVGNHIGKDLSGRRLRNNPHKSSPRGTAQPK